MKVTIDGQTFKTDKIEATIINPPDDGVDYPSETYKRVSIDKTKQLAVLTEQQNDEIHQKLSKAHAQFMRFIGKDNVRKIRMYPEGNGVSHIARSDIRFTATPCDRWVLNDNEHHISYDVLFLTPTGLNAALNKSGGDYKERGLSPNTVGMNEIVIDTLLGVVSFNNAKMPTCLLHSVTSTNIPVANEMLKVGWKRDRLSLVSLPGHKEPAIFRFGGVDYTCPIGKAFDWVKDVIERDGFEGHPVETRSPTAYFKREHRRFFKDLIKCVESKHYWIQTK
jgi:hypothetical protein